MSVELEDLVWLAAGVGLGLFIAMLLLALGVMRDAWAYRRRLMAHRQARAAMASLDEEPTIQPAAAPRPVAAKAVVAESEPILAAAPKPQATAPLEPMMRAAPPEAATPVAAEPSRPAPPQAVETAPAEDAKVVAAEPTTSPVVADAPAAASTPAEPEPAASAPAPAAAPAKPEAPTRTGIQAAVAAALEKRRAERAARLAAGETPLATTPVPPRPRPANDSAAADAATAANVEELFAKAFTASTVTPPASIEPKSDARS